MADKKTSIGGQALIEGIMMRGPEVTAMAVRNASGEIILEKSETKTNIPKILKLPIIRGVYGMISSFTMGYKYLMRSADISLADAEQQIKKDEEAQAAKPENSEATQASGAAETTDTEAPVEAETAVTAEATVTAEAEATVTVEAAESTKNAEITEPTEPDLTSENASFSLNISPNGETVSSDAADKAPVGESVNDIANNAENDASGKASSVQNNPEGKKKKASTSENKALLAVTGTISIIFGLALAILLFVYLPSSAARFVIPGEKASLSYSQAILRSLIECVIKIAILVLYMWLVSFMKDIKRTFMYHGAEHKTIFCYEHGLPLTVENVRKQRRFHPRCGTSFLILMLIIGFLIGIFIPFNNAIIRTLLRIALLPLTVGIGYELIKFAGRHDNLLTKIISAPGVWLQHITTKEPDDGMIECAIAAMNEVIPEDKEKDNW